MKTLGAMDLQHIKDTIPSSPAFVLDAGAMTDTLNLLSTLREGSGCKVLYSIKSLPFSSVLELVQPYVDGFSASSLFEARLAHEFLVGQGDIHLTTPGIRPDEWEALAGLVTHISFNSHPQYQRYAAIAPAALSMGLRVNAKLSFLNDDRFNPSRQYSKLGVSIDELWQSACLDQVKGLHIHNVYSATDFNPLIKTLDKLRSYFGKDLAKLEWLNLGGGYLFKEINDHRPFIGLVSQLKNDYGLDVYIEPGKAVVGDAGYLVATVLDSFVSDGKTLAILDTSINHNPEVFEYQRQPALLEDNPKGAHNVILAGSTCLAGDVFGEYRFSKPLAIGDRVVFKNMGAYSLIKANRFNGYNLPDIYGFQDGQLKPLKHYRYRDYRQQWLADRS
ncbi:MAG: carboxynorspermidine decarboxylase [Methylococcales bacterium]|nr:carboxynorspermidine decarboxylase [Methylococcales bacterium]